MRTQPHRFVMMLLLGGLLLGGCGGAADDPGDAAGEVAEGAGVSPDAVGEILGKLEIENFVVEMGAVDAWSTHTGSFECVNTGTGPIRIEEVKSTCACLIAQPSSMVVQAGETVRVDLALKPQPERGGFRTYRVNLLTNDDRKLEVQVKVELVAVLAVDPINLMLGELPYRQMHREYVTLRSVDPGLEILGIRTPSDEIQVNVLPQGSETQLEIPVDPAMPRTTILEVVVGVDQPWGLCEGSVYIDAAMGDDGENTITLPFRARFFGDISPDPVTFNIPGQTKSGSDVDAIIRLEHRLGEPFEITGWRIDSSTLEDVNLEVVATEGEAHAYDVVFTASTGDYVGTAQGWFVVTTNLPDESELRLRYWMHIIE